MSLGGLLQEHGISKQTSLLVYAVFAPGSLLSFLPFTCFVGTQGKSSCAQIPLVLNYLNFAAVHYNLLSEKCTLHFMISVLA